MHFKINKDGWVYFIFFLIISIIILPFFQIISFIFFAFTFYLYYFFRDPVRSVPLSDLVISPADGIITFIGESLPPFQLDKDTKYNKISIFLNIFNVHVNRIPTSGIIKKINYIEGKFINATLDNST